MFALVVVIAAVAPVSGPAPPAICRFREANSVVHRWEGSCGRLFGQEPTLKLKPVRSIASGRWRRDVEPNAVWAGAMSMEGSRNDPIELELYQAGPGVLRTEHGWYSVSAFNSTPGLNDLRARHLTHGRAIRAGSRDSQAGRCPSLVRGSVESRRRSAVPGNRDHVEHYCAMEHATIEATCGAHHRRPAMELVREIVESRTAQRHYEHRLMDYNNDTTTTLADVHGLFREALSRTSGPPDQPLAVPARCPPPPEPRITAVDIRVVDRARAILGSPNVWDRHGTQQCAAGQKTVSIFCALERASEEITGDFDEVSPVMREARGVVDFVAAKTYEARLVDYNNDPATTFANVQTLFRILRNRLSRRVTP